MRLLLIAAVCAPIAALASQQVLLDITYVHQGTGPEPSHHHMGPPYPGGATPPANWQTPINYYQGKAHFRLEVIAKPSNATINYETCFVQPSGYGCMGAHSFVQTGVFEWDKDLPQMWQYSALDWTKNAVSSEIALVVKDSNFNKIEFNDPRLYPMKLRCTITLVSQGSTYTAIVPDAGISEVGSPDAGARDAGVSDAGIPDAGSSLDSGTSDAGPPTVPQDSGTPLQQADRGPAVADAGALLSPPLPPAPISGQVGCSSGSGQLTEGLLFMATAVLLALRRSRQRC